MISTSILEDKINEYYDEQMNESQLISYEARIANSIMIKEYTYQRCFEYFKISNSIKLTKNRLNKKAQEITDKILADIQKELFFNINPVFLERINKHLRSFFLHIRRHNSQYFYSSWNNRVFVIPTTAINRLY